MAVEYTDYLGHRFGVGDTVLLLSGAQELVLTLDSFELIDEGTSTKPVFTGETAQGSVAHLSLDKERNLWHVRLTDEFERPSSFYCSQVFALKRESRTVFPGDVFHVGDIVHVDSFDLGLFGVEAEVVSRADYYQDPDTWEVRLLNPLRVLTCRRCQLVVATTFCSFRQQR